MPNLTMLRTNRTNRTRSSGGKYESARFWGPANYNRQIFASTQQESWAKNISQFFHARSPGVVIGRWDFLSIRLHLSQQGLALVGCWLNLSRLLISWQKVRIQGEIDYHLLDNLEIEKMFENDARFKELNMTEFIFKTIPDITVVRIQYVDRFTPD